MNAPPPQSAFARTRTASDPQPTIADTPLNRRGERMLIADQGIDYAAMLERTSQWAKTSAAHGPAIGKAKQQDSFMAPYLGGRL